MKAISLFVSNTMITRRINRLTQKDYEGCSNFLLKAISIFVLNTMIRKKNNVTQKDISYMLFIGVHEG